jgi:hypothetical protein
LEPNGHNLGGWKIIKKDLPGENRPFFSCSFATPGAYNIGNSPANLRSRDRAALLKAKYFSFGVDPRLLHGPSSGVANESMQVAS